MTSVLENRTALIAVVLFCLVECVWSWLLIHKYTRLSENPVNVFVVFSVFSIFITLSIAYRSTFWVDRVVFGAIAGESVLAVVKAVVPLTPLALLAINVAKSSMWTIAALVSLIVLVRSSEASRSKNSS